MCMNRGMDNEKYRYVPIDSSLQEGEYPDGKDPCCTGRNGDSGGISRSDGRQARENGDALIEDVLYLQHVGHVTATLSDTRFMWQSIDGDSQKLVTLESLHCFSLYVRSAAEDIDLLGDLN